METWRAGKELRSSAAKEATEEAREPVPLQAAKEDRKIRQMARMAVDTGVEGAASADMLDTNAEEDIVAEDRQGEDGR